MKETNAERVISNFVMGKTYHPKGDKLRIGDCGSVYHSGLRIGQFEEGQVNDTWMKFLRLPLEDHLASWKKYKLQLAREANKWGIIVVFEKNFDIGFGKDEAKETYFSTQSLFEELLKITKYSQDKDLQTAACASIVDGRDSDCPRFDEIVAYSYNQLLNEETWLHAEQAVANYVKFLNDEGYCPTPRRWLTLLQPCEHCLQAMLDLGATDIIYGWAHKEKWNTYGYYNIADKLMKKEYKQSFCCLPILYHMYINRKIVNFYRRK